MSKEYIRDPEVLIQQVYNSVQYLQDKRQQSATEEWQQRNSDNVIGASTNARCPRRSYYTYFADDKSVLEKEFSPNIMEWMYLGLLLEEMLYESLGDIVKDAKKIHIAQNEFPVHMVSPTSTEDMIWAATTDFVLEFELNEVPYYIPIELKSTQLKKWDEFKYHDYHLRQLGIWVQNAKEQELNVPYALLVYVGDLWNRYKKHEVKITCLQVDTKFRKISKTNLVDWEDYRHGMSARREELRECISTKSLPPMPKDVDNYYCNDCPFKSQCFSNINPPGERGTVQ